MLLSKNPYSHLSRRSYGTADVACRAVVHLQHVGLLNPVPRAFGAELLSNRQLRVLSALRYMGRDYQEPTVERTETMFSSKELRTALYYH